MSGTEDRLARALERLDAAVARLEWAAAAAAAERPGEQPAAPSAGAGSDLEQRHAQAVLGLDATIGRLRTLLDGVERG